MAGRKARRTTAVGVITAVAVVAALEGLSAAPAAAAGQCPFTTGFPRAHSGWIGRVIETNLSTAGECGAAYAGGRRGRRDTSCQPYGQIRVAVWGTWFFTKGDYITVRTYVEARRAKRWVSSTATGLHWSADTRRGKATSLLPWARLTFRGNPIPGWWQVFAEHTFVVGGPISGKLAGELVRVHVVMRWKTAATGISDPTRATFDNYIGPYCFAQEDETGQNGGPNNGPGITPVINAPAI